MTKPKLSLGLLNATRAALVILNRHWPKKFGPMLLDTEDAANYREEYAAALVFCDFDKIPAAAIEWVATERFGPSASELGEIARRLTFESRPVVVPQKLDAPPPSLDKNGPRTDALYKAIKERLIERGYTRPAFASPIGQIWALMYEQQPTQEQADAVRLGDVQLDVVYAYVDLWLGGARPTPNPMNNLGESMAKVMTGAVR